jgi:hypothetical protein
MTRAAVAAIEQTGSGVILRLHARLAALQTLAKRAGFYETPKKHGMTTVEQ